MSVGEPDRRQSCRRIRLIQYTHLYFFPVLGRKGGNAKVYAALLYGRRKTSVLGLALLVKTQFREYLNTRDDGLMHPCWQLERRVEAAIHAETNAALGR